MHSSGPMTHHFDSLSPERRKRALQCLLGRQRIYVIAYDREGRIFYSDGKLLERRGLKPMELVGTSVFDQSHDRPENLEVHHRTLGGEELVTRGSLNGQMMECHFTPFFGANGQVEEVWGVAIDVSDSDRLSRERDFLLEMHRTLAESLDYETTLERVARLALGVFADYCIIRLVDDNEPGQLRLIAVAHVNPRMEDVAFELHRKYTRKSERTAPLYQVLDTGKTVAYLNITDEQFATAAGTEQEHQALVALAACSSLLVPLIARGTCLGVVSFSSSRHESGRNYGDDDLRFAEELALCMALAVERAQLYRAALGGKSVGVISYE